MRSTSNVDQHDAKKNGVKTSSDSTTAEASSGTGQQPHKRRSLFPSYESRSKPGTTNSVSFAPMAWVVTVKSKNDMVAQEKSDIWWQRSDYEDFRKTGRIITRAMLEGGSKIWLASNESSWKKNKDKKKNKNTGDHVDESPESSESGDTISATGDKWWHKFGHSRRGLEHVVLIDEGRQ